MSQPLLLTGAQLVDGTGAPPRPADVLIENGDITAVEPPGTLPTSLPTRDLTGLVLAPGFIDVHSHADNSPLLLHHDTTKISQGVTTEAAPTEYAVFGWGDSHGPPPTQDPPLP
ncbi:hypothetical protein [Saccharopolyspora rectivirgula]|uniref:hypothetical protein n=1 Tax=Saccharopolyspora rectivirgula TaxID=28042 RepID=UPI00240963C2|nr:hypothetical protein [Saccharopolyspora rectivirgula]